MQNDITKKIRSELGHPFRSERQVVYLLVQVRKLLDSISTANKYCSLRLYCDWAVHTKLDRSLASSIVEKVDELYPKMVRGTRLSDHEHDELFGIFALDSFREDFKNFLLDKSLPNSICKSDKRWAIFLSHYLRVIQDCPLVCQSSKRNLKELYKIVLTEHPQAPTASTGLFPLIRWEFYFDNQDKGSFELNRRPRVIEVPGRRLTVLQSAVSFL